MMREQYNRRDAQVVKGFAILLLLFYHLFKDLLIVTDVNIKHFFFSDSAFASIADACRVCVAIFVFVSSYGIAKSVMDQDTLDVMATYKQALNRGNRLMINFLFLFVSVNLLWFWYFDYKTLYGGGKQAGIFIMLDALGLSEVFGTPTLNETWWYMGIAYTIVFSVPAIAIACKKIGYGILPFAVLLPYCISLDLNLQFYLATIILAVVVAYGGWLDKVKSKKINALIGLSLSVLVLIAMLIIRQNAVVKDYIRPIVDAVGAFFTCVFAGCFVTRLKVVSNFLAYVGKHSLNIFLVHSFFYLILWRKYIYMPKHAVLIFFTLLISSLAYSVMLELIKRTFCRLCLRIRRKRR